MALLDGGGGQVPIPPPPDPNIDPATGLPWAIPPPPGDTFEVQPPPPPMELAQPITPMAPAPFQLTPEQQAEIDAANAATAAGNASAPPLPPPLPSDWTTANEGISGGVGDVSNITTPPGDPLLEPGPPGIPLPVSDFPPDFVPPPPPPLPLSLPNAGDARGPNMTSQRATSMGGGSAANPLALSGARPAWATAFRGLQRSPFAAWAGMQGQQPLASPSLGGRFAPEGGDPLEEERRRMLALLGLAPNPTVTGV